MNTRYRVWADGVLAEPPDSPIPTTVCGDGKVEFREMTEEEAVAFDRRTLDSGTPTEHSVHEARPVRVMSDAWAPVSSLRFRLPGAEFWFAADADVENVDLRVKAGDLAWPAVRIEDRGAVAFPPGLSYRGSRWLWTAAPRGYWTVTLEARGAGTVWASTLWATTTDPGGRAPGEMFGRGR